jgi:hypothetical protein
MLESPTIDAVVGCVEGAFREEGDIAGLKASRPNRGKWPMPVKDFTSNLLRRTTQRKRWK